MAALATARAAPIRRPQQRRIRGLERFHRAKLLLVLDELGHELGVAELAVAKLRDALAQLRARRHQRRGVELETMCDEFLRMHRGELPPRVGIRIGNREVEDVGVLGSHDVGVSEKRAGGQAGHLRSRR